MSSTMKRLAAAGTFSLLAGAFGLLLFASIFYSCRQGGHPHEMGTSSETEAQVRTPPASLTAGAVPVAIRP